MEGWLEWKYSGCCIGNPAEPDIHDIVILTCSCGYSYTEGIPALGHSFREEVVPATAKANGSIAAKCSRCETAASEEVIYAANSIKLSQTSYTYNDYSGTGKRTFTINPKSTSILKLTPQKKGFTVKWKKQGKQVSGYQIAYSTSSKFPKSKTTLKKIKGSKAATKKYSNLKRGKKYYVRVRTYQTVGRKTYYSAWSGKKPVRTKK